MISLFWLLRFLIPQERTTDCNVVDNLQSACNKEWIWKLGRIYWLVHKVSIKSKSNAQSHWTCNVGYSVGSRTLLTRHHHCDVGLTSWYVHLRDAESSEKQCDAESWIIGEGNEHKKYVRGKMSIDHCRHRTKPCNQLGRQNSTDASYDIADEKNTANLIPIKIILLVVVEW